MPDSSRFNETPCIARTSSTSPSPRWICMRLALIFVCVVALARNGTAQSPSPEKAPAQASLEGKVVKEPAAEPLKNAIIELIGENQRSEERRVGKECRS